MSTTIDSLDIQITTSAGQAEAKIDALATALGRLKENGKITIATNGLKKLADALNTLNPALNGMNTAKLAELGRAVSGLSGIQKLSGLNSALNTLGKLPTLVNGLDSANLTKFATQMENLAKAMTPLATQIDKIGNGFSKLPTQVNKAVTATNRMADATEKAAKASREHGSAINFSSLNIMSAIHNFNAMISAAQTVANILQATLEDAMEWDGIQFRFGRAFGEDADETYAYIQRLNEALGINIQQFMQYSSLYGSLLSGFGMAQEKVTTISVGLTELSYDIWAAYNDRFKTLEDASEAVRSAITGEIEPIRNAGIALTEASLQEYLDQIGMANVSIEKLSEAQKAEVRYAAMMNAAMNQGIVGTYASEMQTAEGAVRGLAQSFKGLVQAFGSLFIPILQAAIPYLTAFIELLYEAVAAIASFFGIAFFEIDWGDASGGVGDMAAGMQDAAAGAGGVASGVGGAADAAKKLKDYMMGFDELNVINPPDESSGGGGGGGGGGAGGTDWGDGLNLDTLWDESIFAKASKQVDELKQKIKDWFDEWKLEIGIITGALGLLSIASLLSQLGTAIGLGDGFLKVMNDIKKVAALAIVLTVQWTLQSESFKSFIETGEWEELAKAAIIGALGALASYAIWGPKGIVLSLAITAVAALDATFDDGKIDSKEEVTTGLLGLASAIGAIGLAIKTWGPIIAGSKFGQYISALISSIGGNSAASSALTFIAPTLTKIGSAFVNAAKAVGTFVGGLSAGALAAIAAIVLLLASAAYFLYENWEKVVDVAKRFFDENIAPKLAELKKHWDKLKKTLSPVTDLLKKLGGWLEECWRGIKNFIEVVKFVKPLEDFWNALKKIFEVIGGYVFTSMTTPLVGMLNAFMSLLEGLVQLISGVVQIFTGLFQLIRGAVTGDLVDVIEGFNKIKEGAMDAFLGLYDATIGVIVSFVEGVIEWCLYLWDELVGHSIIPDTINAIIEWFCSLPDEINDTIQKFCEDIKGFFTDLWDDIKLWFNTNVAPKFTKTYWRGVFDKVVTGASEKLGELKGAISEKWSGVKTWYNETIAPIFTKAHWKTKVDTFKERGKEIIDNIKSGLKTKWDELKKWWEELELPEFKIKTPHLTWTTTEATGWIADTLEALGMPTKIPKLNVEWYAQGGFPDMGSLFVANEAGPELVGRIGGRTAVANNDQIVAAVSQGVYSAVVSAMASSGGNSGQNINVYLDGKQIYASVKKVEAERGMSLMGNQLGYAY